ncbi:pyridoxamine 5'-phosphate oxidase family protein [Nocardioides hwasunensis]|uniref:Pyridoxamine 5'-phosphate oxidase family protein n=1 Tax=Nocardioides hwasunensis TaxID=397258 RepID=A0ABR8MGY1_9ACTN|nr:pyridoxamine 5'-phosphate oxidase family protein [Nocardioides hwasunensis]MBD3914800.1 pyridoxamine 5'-phosphate oxidase family protein [Nocardioides hwasunensis]
MAQQEDDRAKVVELVGRATSAMLTTMTADGDHVSRPMAVQEMEFDGDLWFFTYDDSPKAQQIAAHPKVNVALANDSKSEWTSIAGTAEVVHDRTKAEELWSKPLEAWFPDGLETPGLCLLKVHGDTAEFWDASSSKARQLLGMVKAIRNDDPDEFPSDNRTVEL